MRSAAFLLGAGAVLLTGACSSSGGGDGAPDATVSPSTPAELSGTELQNRWWEWAGVEPLHVGDMGPVDDPDGRLCDRDQPADVWFLAGTHDGPAKRACRVPTDVPIAFPLVSRITSQGGCDDLLAVAKGSATLDGRALEPVRLKGTPVTGVPGSLACGLWVRAGRLSSGTHFLHFEGSAGSFSTAVDYRLTAGAR
ncbi:signal protein [Streptomyces sp. URMC 126]